MVTARTKKIPIEMSKMNVLSYVIAREQQSTFLRCWLHIFSRPSHLSLYTGPPPLAAIRALGTYLPSTNGLFQTMKQRTRPDWTTLAHRDHAVPIPPEHRCPTYP